MATLTRPQDTDTKNQKVLDRLARVVRRADDFVLGFVKCNHLPQQEEMRQALLSHLADTRVLEILLDAPIVSLLDEITARWDADNPPDVVCVYGLRHSILVESSPVLGRLNNDRDLIRRAVQVPLLIWLPDFALDLVARGAPDFWAWRSGVYEFQTDRTLWEADSLTALTSNPSMLSSLTLGEKRGEIARIEELVCAARGLPKQSKREHKLIAGLLYQLGSLHDSLSDWHKAHALFEQCLAISEQMNDKPMEAIALHYLGIVNQHLGNLGEAKDLLQRSLKLKMDWGNPAALSSPYHQLGKIAYAQGNLREAVALYEKSLQTAQEANSQVGVAMALHHLGMIAHDQGNFLEAARLYKECLRRAQEQNAADITVNTLHQLGLLEHDSGDLPEAERLYNQSLSLAEQMGDRIGVAISCLAIGDLHQEKVDLRMSLHMYLGALAVFDDLHAVEDKWRSRKRIQQVRGRAGEEQFQAWLLEKYGKKEAHRLTQELDREDAGVATAA